MPAAFNPKDLENLFGALVQAGVPMVASAFGGPLAGAAVSAVLPEIAAALGLDPAAPPAAVAAAVAADPQAAGDKLAALEDKRKTELAVMQLQVDQNNVELTQPGPGFLRFFYGGWRPAAGWLLLPVPTFYQIIACAVHLALLPDSFFVFAVPVWISLAGIRTYERIQGVSLDTLALRPRGK